MGLFHTVKKLYNPCGGITHYRNYRAFILSITRRIRIRVEREITKNQDQLNQLLDNYEEVIRTLETFVEMFK